MTTNPTIGVAILDGPGRGRRLTARLLGEEGSCAESHRLHVLLDADDPNASGFIPVNDVVDLELRLDDRPIFDGLATLGVEGEIMTITAGFQRKLDVATIGIFESLLKARSRGTPCAVPAFRHYRQIEAYLSACRMFPPTVQGPMRRTEDAACIDAASVRYFDEIPIRIGHGLFGPGCTMGSTVGELRNVLCDELDVAGVRIEISRFHEHVGRLTRNARRVHALCRVTSDAASREGCMDEAVWNNAYYEEYLATFIEYRAELVVG